MTERQWRLLGPLPPPDPRRGEALTDHRRVLNDILGARRLARRGDVPQRYGPWQTCYDRFVRWACNGVWQRILQQLQAKADAADRIDWDGTALDARHIKAHRSASGARNAVPRAEKKGL